MDLVSFMNSSVSPFHTVANIRNILFEAGFTELRENEKWDLMTGGKYFVARNSSSVIAFSVGKSHLFRIVASHTDSPCFRLKHNAELVGGDYLRLNTECYGGMNLSTWFDRPLDIAGRVFVSENGALSEILVSTEGGSAVIPSLAIHLDRDLNEGRKADRQNDLLPVFASSKNAGTFLSIIASNANVDENDIVSTELYLVNGEKAFVWGTGGEFISSPRLDDLQCVYSSLCGFVNSSGSGINVLCCFDNEEVGSATRQGALSNYLPGILNRIASCLSFDKEEYSIALDNSFLISADNAHAVHPGHPEKTDAVNKCRVNGGVVIKQSASQRYMSDGFCEAYLVSLCRENDIPYQFFVNNSNIAGGSTLGNLLNTHLGIRGIDIGAAQLSMHSALETAGTSDTESLIRLFNAYYSL